MPARLDGAACVVTLIYGAHELVVDAGDLTVAELQSAFQDVLSLDAIPEVYLNGERVKEPDIAPRSGDRLDFMKPGGVKGSNVVCDLNEFVTVFDVSAEELCQLREAGVPFVPYGSYTVIGIKEGRRALEQIRQQPATVEQVVRVDPELGVVFYRGNAYEMDQLYLGNRSQGGHTRNRKNAEDRFSRDFRCSERLLEYPGSGILRVDDEIHARIFQVA